VRSAHLVGREHPVLGAVAAVAEGPAAIALSRGGAPKTYEYVDPNEDAACFALGSAGALVAVADGHRGCEGAERALAELVRACGEGWTEGRGPAPGRWREEALAVLWSAHEALRRAANERPGARTTLALALARFAEERLFWASLGDSHVFRVTATGAYDLSGAMRGCPHNAFLGGEALSAEKLAEHAAAGELPAAETRALVLATDGVSEPEVGIEDPAGALAELAARSAGSAPGLRPLETARGLVELANATHARRAAGDNVAVAALWSEWGG
jgi:serine/threonine protein phosphatase PrpC